MKTLYISDLDGTLLNMSAELSEYTATTINRLIEQGLNFSVATARSHGSAIKILSELKLKIPVILMNGVVVYDINAEKSIKTETIKPASVKNLLDILKENNMTGFLYTEENGKPETYFENLDTPHRKTFYDERVKKYGKTFVKVDNFTQCLDKQVIYFSVCDKKELVEPICEQLKLDGEVNFEFYRDVYAEEYWYLEICAAAASKQSAVEFLRKQYGFEMVISFGDNLNDLPMFEASDECYAAFNAKDEVKSRAGAVIGSNNDDGVAKWLKVNAKLLDNCG